jgi:hypothetical protein
MHEQPFSQVDAVEHMILCLLLEQAQPWTSDAIVREIGQGPLVTDAIFGLCASGLVDETDGVLYATSAAARDRRSGAG